MVKLYATYLRKCGPNCLLKKVKTLKPTIAQTLRLPQMLEDEGLGYGDINTARCALSLILTRIDGQTVGKHQLVHWFIRSIYERNPPKPKYNRVWDVMLVFSLFKDWPDNKNLSLKMLSFKVAILLLLVSYWPQGPNHCCFVSGGT